MVDNDGNPEGRLRLPPFREVFDEHAAYVWRSLRHLGVPDAELPDLCQEVFVVVHRRLPDFEGRSSLKTWLYGICVRVAAGRRRLARVQREAPVAELPERPHLPDQEISLERRENLRLLQQAIEGLDPDRRAVFVAYEIENTPMKEVALALECPLQTVYSRLHSARDEVQRTFRRLAETRRA